MTQISVIDYGVGNIFSMVNALKKTDANVIVANDPYEIISSDGIVLPGVGNFGAAVLKMEPLVKTINKAVDEGSPILGSCLGMQLMFENSEEAGGEGLGLFKGKIRKFSNGVKIPHMGWNTIDANYESPLLEDIPDGSYFYFVHSYYPDPLEQNYILAKTVYGQSFASIIQRKNIYGCQFHPEKSGMHGGKLLKNFIEIIRR